MNPQQASSQEVSSIELSGGNSGNLATGTVCPETSLYKAADGTKITYIEYVEAGSLMPPLPSGSGKGNANWVRLTLAADGSKTEIKAAAVL